MRHTYGGAAVRKFSDTIVALSGQAKGADHLVESQRIVGFVRENWLAGKLVIYGRLNGEGVLKVVRPDPFLRFTMDVVRTELVWRIRYQPEGSRSPREGFWGDLAISDDGSRTISAVKAEQAAGDLMVKLVERAERPASIPHLIEDLREQVAPIGHLSDAAAKRQWAKHAPLEWKKGGRRKKSVILEIK
jgi:hypothetical protein